MQIFFFFLQYVYWIKTVLTWLQHITKQDFQAATWYIEYNDIATSHRNNVSVQTATQSDQQ